MTTTNTDPAQTIDRDALKYQLIELFQDQENGGLSFNEYIDRILALLRPDTRIAAIEALCDANNVGPADVMFTSDVLAILQGK